jgi:hypothetical protein
MSVVGCEITKFEAICQIFFMDLTDYLFKLTYVVKSRKSWSDMK